MIKWKSLIFFILTLSIILGAFSGAVCYTYRIALKKVAEKYPEILITPKDSTVFIPDKKVIKKYIEYKDSGYSIMLPRGCNVIKRKNDPTIDIIDPHGDWEIRIREKLLRFEDTIQSSNLPENPRGDYYRLFDEIFKSTDNPILLFQKKTYLPLTTTNIKRIRTPNFFGFYIVAKEDNRRLEIYRLFDNQYWHNITVSMKNPEKSQRQVHNIIGALKNCEDTSSEEEEGS